MALERSLVCNLDSHEGTDFYCSVGVFVRSSVHHINTANSSMILEHSSTLFERDIVVDCLKFLLLRFLRTVETRGVHGAWCFQVH